MRCRSSMWLNATWWSCGFVDWIKYVHISETWWPAWRHGLAYWSIISWIEKSKFWHLAREQCWRSENVLLILWIHAPLIWDVLIGFHVNLECDRSTCNLVLTRELIYPLYSIGITFSGYQLCISLSFILPWWDNSEVLVNFLSCEKTFQFVKLLAYIWITIRREIIVKVTNVTRAYLKVERLVVCQPTDYLMLLISTCWLYL